MGSVFDSITSSLTTLSGAAFPFFAESNRNTEALRGIRAQESVALANRGFTTGRARLDPNTLLGRLSLPSVGGGFSLGSIGPSLPLIGLGLVALMLVKR